MVQIISTPMCHTYLESPGHAVRHGGTLDGSYYWEILSNSRFSFICLWGKIPFLYKVDKEEAKVN